MTENNLKNFIASFVEIESWKIEIHDFFGQKHKAFFCNNHKLVALTRILKYDSITEKDCECYNGMIINLEKIKDDK